MIAVLRQSLRLASLASKFVALWLAWVVLTVLPARDPGHVQLWAIVAAWAAALVVASIAATRGDGSAARSATAALGLLSVGALAFGLLVVVTFTTGVPSGRETEGYLLVVGAVLALHGALGVAWTARALVASLPWSTRTGAHR